MRYYKVFFEIYGKKMVTEVFAKDETEAKGIVSGKLKFNKVERVPPKTTFGDVNIDNAFEQIFGKTN